MFSKPCYFKARNTAMEETSPGRMRSWCAAGQFELHRLFGTAALDFERDFLARVFLLEPIRQIARYDHRFAIAAQQDVARLQTGGRGEWGVDVVDRELAIGSF